MMTLTARQDQLLAYLQGRINGGNGAPTLAEMGAAMGLRSKSGVHRLLLALEERGHLRRPHGRHQAIELVHRSEKLTVTIGDDGDIDVVVAPDVLAQHGDAILAKIEERFAAIDLAAMEDRS